MRAGTQVLPAAVMAVMLLGLVVGCELDGKAVSDQHINPCEGKILFQLEGQIQIMNANGSNLTRLADGVDPAWSPNCKKIVFARAFEYEGSRGTNYRYEIFVMNADGSHQTQLPGGSGGLAPSWSPYGNKVAFQKDDEIYVINADGSGDPMLLTSSSSRDPAWSPDGKKIAFMSYRAVPTNRYGIRTSDIYIINACCKEDSANQALQLTEHPVLYDEEPAWSPDGTQIAFTRVNANYSDRVDVYKIDADGSGVTRLTHDQDRTEADPTWSPDGKKIAFVSADSAIYTMDSDGSNPTIVRKFVGQNVQSLDWR